MYLLTLWTDETDVVASETRMSLFGKTKNSYSITFVERMWVLLGEGVAICYANRMIEDEKRRLFSEI